MSGADNADVFRPFRPRRGRAVAITAAVLLVAVFSVVAWFTPGADDGGPWTPADRLMLVLLGMAIGAFLLRYALIRAVPTRDGLEIRNLLRTTRLVWPQILQVRFSGGDPWVRLDLDDTETIAVMAIQKADGPIARAEADRLATLVAALGETADPPTDASPPAPR